MIIRESNEVGVVGLGLMGCSIVAAMLMRGYKVIAVAPLDIDLELAPRRIQHALQESFKQGIHSHDVTALESNLHFTKNYGDLRNCFFISECVIENVDINRQDGPLGLARSVGVERPDRTTGSP